MRIKIFTLIITIIFLSVFQQKQSAQSVQKEKTGKVIVFLVETSLFEKIEDKVEFEDEFFPQYEVYLEGKDFSQEIPFINSRKAELDVSEGIYNIILKSEAGGILNYQRANFHVYPDQIKTINLNRLEGEDICSDEFGFAYEPIAHNSKPSKYKSPKYDKFLFDKPYEISIKYCKKKIRKNVITYRYALITYKDFIMYADKLVFDRENHDLSAKSDKKSEIMIKIGDYVKEKKSIKFNLKNLDSIDK